jgi:hypothetical protein
MSNDRADYTDDILGVIRSLERLRADLAGTGATVPMSSASAPSAVPLSEDAPVLRLFHALDNLPVLVGYLNARRSSSPLFQVDSEAAVQDLLFLTLKSHFPDLVYEEPTRKGAAGYSVGDFCVPSLKLILEAKYIASAQDAKAKADEIAEDIWKYTTQTDCQRIVFFIYDPHLSIADRANYTKALSAHEGEFVSRGRPIEIHVVIKP